MHGLIKIINMFLKRGKFLKHNHISDACVFFSSSELCLLLLLQVCPDRLKGQDGFRALVAP